MPEPGAAQPADEVPGLAEIRSQLEQQEKAYAEVLAAVDALAAFALPAEKAGERETLERLNALWAPPETAPAHGWFGAVQRRVLGWLAPIHERQTAFNAALVQLLNARLAETNRLHAGLRELAAALVRYAQRVEPLVDARARLASGLATTHAELMLEAFGRQLESQTRRLEALRAQIESLGASAEPRA